MDRRLPIAIAFAAVMILMAVPLGESDGSQAYPDGCIRLNWMDGDVVIFRGDVEGPDYTITRVPFKAPDDVTGWEFDGVKYYGSDIRGVVIGPAGIPVWSEKCIYALHDEPPAEEEPAPDWEQIILVAACAAVVISLAVWYAMRDRD